MSKGLPWEVAGPQQGYGPDWSGAEGTGLTGFGGEGAAGTVSRTSEQTGEGRRHPCKHGHRLRLGPGQGRPSQRDRGQCRGARGLSGQ